MPPAPSAAPIRRLRGCSAPPWPATLPAVGGLVAGKQRGREFLAQWERAAVPTVPLKFRGKAGQAISYLTSICAFTKDGQKYFVLQLLPGERARRSGSEGAGRGCRSGA